MKLFIPLVALTTLLPGALSCLHTWAYIFHDPFLGTNMDSGAAVVDNGVTVCSNDWGLRTDQDGHFSFVCLPGYVYAVTKDGRQSWFQNNAGNAFSWINSNNKDTYCCHGACDDKGAHIACSDYHYDTWQFC
ncbi:hypothetical protein BCR34DRAFT_595683 [Clohesyomyces aquaticus]|uniref:Cyanovirin-N domain-containing protein n=1 Tax=Clohesyomyces aquaticus TaxID=1231657 RepID=A0A1Y2A9U6_9PLEO|nr:hypothetical protein BCR34DRAFT_595683 [Clohesyomyces aquaticus]